MPIMVDGSEKEEWYCELPIPRIPNLFDFSYRVISYYNAILHGKKSKQDVNFKLLLYKWSTILKDYKALEEVFFEDSGYILVPKDTGL